MSSKIFILHRSPTYKVLLADFLAFNGFCVRPFSSYDMALRLDPNEDYDLGIIEISSQEDLALINTIKSKLTELAIVAMVNPVFDGETDSLNTLDMQALPANMTLAEVLDAVNNVFTHSENYRNSKRASLQVGPLVLNLKQQSASIRDKKMALTLTEFTLLELLAKNLDEAVSKDIIYPKVLGRAKGRFDRSIDVHVSSIRHKIAEIGCTDVCIESVRGVGYRLVCKNVKP